MESNEHDFQKRQEHYDSTYEFRKSRHLRLKHGWMDNMTRYRVKLVKKILSELGVNKNSTILDIGCGVSIFSSVFKPEECPKITAFDISRKTIEEAKKMNPHINYLVDDAQNPKIEGKFDFIHAGEIIEHLPDPKEALKNDVVY